MQLRQFNIIRKDGHQDLEGIAYLNRHVLFMLLTHSRNTDFGEGCLKPGNASGNAGSHTETMIKYKNNGGVNFKPFELSIINEEVR